MALTNFQRLVIGVFIISILSIFSFVGYKQLFGKTFKVYQDNYIEFGVENGTIVCKECEREFYIKLKSRVKIPEDYKIKYNITDTYTYSINIPNSEYRKMWSIELFDAMNNEKLNIPFQVWYKSGINWSKYPPSKVSLTLSTAPKRFKVTATIPDDIAISGLIGLKFKLFEQTIDINQDPIWWINGNPIAVNILKDCSIVQQIYEVPIYVVKLKNQTYIYINNITQTNETRLFFYNVEEYIGTSFNYVNTSSCRDVGFKLKGKTINYEKQGWNCQRIGFIIECTPEFEGSSCLGRNSGKNCVRIDIRDFSKDVRIDSPNIKELEIE